MKSLKQNPGRAVFSRVFIILPMIVMTLNGCSFWSSGRKYKAPQVSVDRDLNYPLSAQMANIQGSALVSVFVGETGQPEQIVIARSSGSAVLDSAATEFASMVQYEPATIDGVAFGAWTNLELRYHLSDIAFDENSWLNDVLDLQRKIEKSDDPYARNVYLQRLYLKYLGMISWAKTTDAYNVKLLLEHTIKQETWDTWKDLLTVLPSVFVLFSDFYFTYTDCEFKEKVKETLITQIIETRSYVKIKAEKSARFMEKAPDILQRLDALQNSLNPVP